MKSKSWVLGLWVAAWLFSVQSLTQYFPMPSAWAASTTLRAELYHEYSIHLQNTPEVPITDSLSRELREKILTAFPDVGDPTFSADRIYSHFDALTHFFQNLRRGRRELPPDLRKRLIEDWVSQARFQPHLLRSAGNYDVSGWMELLNELPELAEIPNFIRPSVSLKAASLKNALPRLKIWAIGTGFQLAFSPASRPEIKTEIQTRFLQQYRAWFSSLPKANRISVATLLLDLHQPSPDAELRLTFKLLENDSEESQDVLENVLFQWLDDLTDATRDELLSTSPAGRWALHYINRVAIHGESIHGFQNPGKTGDLLEFVLTPTLLPYLKLESTSLKSLELASHIGNEKDLDQALQAYSFYKGVTILCSTGKTNFLLDSIEDRLKTALQHTRCSPQLLKIIEKHYLQHYGALQINMTEKYQACGGTVTPGTFHFASQ